MDRHSVRWRCIACHHQQPSFDGPVESRNLRWWRRVNSEATHQRDALALLDCYRGSGDQRGRVGLLIDTVAEPFAYGKKKSEGPKKMPTG
jgi:hypothetical protein